MKQGSSLMNVAAGGTFSMCYFLFLPACQLIANTTVEHPPFPFLSFSLTQSQFPYSSVRSDSPASSVRACSATPYSGGRIIGSLPSPLVTLPSHIRACPSRMTPQILHVIPNGFLHSLCLFRLSILTPSIFGVLVCLCLEWSLSHWFLSRQTISYMSLSRSVSFSYVGVSLGPFLACLCFVWSCSHAQSL